MKISIRGKLLLAFTAIILPMSVIWLLDYLNHAHLADAVNRIYTHPLAVTRASLKANSDIMAMHRSMKDVVLSSNKEEMDNAIATVDSLESRVFDELAIVRERILGDEGKKLADDTYQVFKDWRPIRQEVINLVTAGKKEEAIAITKGQGADHVRHLDAKAEELWMYAEKKGSAFKLEARAFVISSAWKDVLAFITVILVSSALALYLSFSISSRLRRLKSAAKKMAVGDLSQSVYIKGGDEIAELGEEFNLMAKQLSESYSFLVREISERKRAEEAIAKSEMKYRTLVESTEVVAWEYDWKDQRFIFITETAISKYGYSKGEWLKKGFWADHIYHEDRERIVNHCLRASEKGLSHDFEYRFVHADGHNVWVRDIVSVEMEGGEPSLLRGFLIDIDERKRMEEGLLEAKEKAEESGKKYRTLFEGTNASVMLLDKTGFIDCNEATWRMFGCENKEEFLCKHPGEWSPPYQPNGRASMEYADEKIAEAFEKGGLLFEWTHIRKNGAPFQAEVLLTSLEIDGAAVLQAIVTDISKQKKNEEALVKAKEEAEEATRLKDKFVSLVSHDLRSPFTSILGTLNLFSNDVNLKLNSDQRKLLDVVLKSGERMVSMIEKILDISRLKTGNVDMKLKFLDGHIIVGAVLSSMSFSAQEKGIRIVNEIPEGMRIFADATLFSEVIANLVSNAIKFCGKGDTVTLFVPKGRATTIAVKDNGPGIDERMIPDLFKSEIKTTTSGSLGEQGTGLGLPYSYDIMKAHGGELTVESEKGKGSVFYAELPHVKPRILIIDDEPEVREMIAYCLDEVKAEIVEAGNGLEALDVIKNNPPHLIISDIRMPVMDGFSFLKALKRHDKMKSIPVIVVTANGQMETSEKVFRLGAEDFISKPIKKDDFIPRVRKHII
ncbi:hypothetical protein MNBD_NITROSPINAE02-476 [hydrothermal vent metagenome]|uniref:histidine kinase n=1 Tax=hydrothermal vent metagenome TaxID=652676 RepID=A0A3B1BYZ0_9ZZZZ